MAAGAGFYDAEGVWQYGETDNIGTLFSDFMNVAPVSISTQFAADRSRLTTLETAVNNPTVYVANSSAARDAYWGVPTTGSTQLALQNLGATTIRTDLGRTEQYLANYSGGNLGGAKTQGWYPLSGNIPVFLAPVTGAQSIPNGAWVQLTTALGTPTVNRGFTSWTSSALTIAIEGVYRVTVTASFGTTSSMGVTVNLNSTSLGTNTTWLGYSQSTANSETYSGIVALTAGDVLRFGVSQISGAAIVTQNNYGNRVNVEWISPRQT